MNRVQEEPFKYSLVFSKHNKLIVQCQLSRHWRCSHPPWRSTKNTSRYPLHALPWFFTPVSEKQLVWEAFRR